MKDRDKRSKSDEHSRRKSRRRLISTAVRMRVEELSRRVRLVARSLHAREEHVCAPGAWNLLGEGADGFRCCWRTCSHAEPSKTFRARYQLLYHLQNTHCGERIHRISVRGSQRLRARVLGGYFKHEGFRAGDIRYLDLISATKIQENETPLAG